jgi:DNA-binding transcriptional MocR family regulator
MINSVTENIIITTGSQQAIDIIGKIFPDPGDYVLCGLPSYLGGLITGEPQRMMYQPDKTGRVLTYRALSEFPNNLRF